MSKCTQCGGSGSNAQILFSTIDLSPCVWCGETGEEPKVVFGRDPGHLNEYGSSSGNALCYRNVGAPRHYENETYHIMQYIYPRMIDGKIKYAYCQQSWTSTCLRGLMESKNEQLNWAKIFETEEGAREAWNRKEPVHLSDEFITGLRKLAKPIPNKSWSA